ncbi:MAG: recombinase XerC [Firmicutes bacterium]|nr:recombinase XerC [Bacillota bacterium]
MFEQFIESLRQQGKSELTLRQYRSDWNRFYRWIQSETGELTDGQEVTQLDVANFKRWASQHYKPRTVSLNLVHLSVYYRWLVNQGVIPDNPCDNVDPVTVQQTAPKWLSRNEQNTLVRAVRKHGNARELAIITVLLHTGIRVQELCDLRLRDVQLGERKGQLIVQNGKGGKYRVIPLNLDARKVLQDYLSERQSDSHYVFITQRSPKMTPRAVQFILAKYSLLTGIEVTPHILRHSFCHELAVRNVPLDVIARLAGHTKKDGTPNLAMVTRYTMPSQDDLARAVEQLSWK